MSERSEQIDRGLDGMMAGIHNLYDISKALPHPYDAYNDLSRTLLHDFAGVAYGIKSYIALLEMELAIASTDKKEG